MEGQKLSAQLALNGQTLLKQIRDGNASEALVQLQQPCDVNVVDKEGRTPLLHAMQHRLTEVSTTPQLP